MDYRNKMPIIIKAPEFWSKEEKKKFYRQMIKNNEMSLIAIICWIIPIALMFILFLFFGAK